MTEIDNILQTIIIGSGPAGFTAAIYTARAGMSTLLITGMELGGQLTTTTEVENFPGYPDGIMGPEMMMQFQKQAERFGTKILIDAVTEVAFTDKAGGIHIVKTSSGKEFQTRTVIVSTGASAKYLGKPFEQTFRGGGLSACATCDGFFFRGRDVIVVGGGDTAAEEAVYLSKICQKVYLVIRKDYLRASKIMQERVLNTPNIEILFNHEVADLKGDKVVQEAVLFNNKTQKEITLSVDGVFIAIGHKPNTEIFAGKLDMDNDSYLIVKPYSTETNVHGVFAAGDVADKKYRQGITAAGSGCMAALDAERYLVEFGSN
jgi:thioredoxin reductase (NADPH)